MVYVGIEVLVEAIAFYFLRRGWAEVIECSVRESGQCDQLTRSIQLLQRQAGTVILLVEGSTCRKSRRSSESQEIANT